MASTQQLRAAPTPASGPGRLRRVAELLSGLPESEYAAVATRDAMVSREPRLVGRKRSVQNVISELPIDEYDAAAQKKAQYARRLRRVIVNTGAYTSSDMRDLEVDLNELFSLVRDMPVELRPALKEMIVNFRRGKTITARGPVEALSHPGADATSAQAVPRQMLAAGKRGRRGPRVKPDQRLPERAPEFYEERAKRVEIGGRKENVVQFLERVYAPWLDILSRADLRRLDKKADAAVENWLSAGKQLPAGLLPRESELNTKLLLASDVAGEFLRGNDVAKDNEKLRLARLLEKRLRKGLIPT